MIRQFRKLTPLNLFFLVVIAVVLRFGLLVHLPENLEYNFIEPFFRLLLSVPSESPFTPFGNVFFASIVILIQAILLNRIINHHNLLGKPSFLPALMYVTNSAILTPFLVLSPTLLCNLE
jgi:hypothetical protein